MRNLLHHLLLQVSFFDQRYNEKGESLIPLKYRNLVAERYAISSNINTSYEDVGKMTPTERHIILQMLKARQDKLKEDMEKRKQDSATSRR